LLSQEFQGHSTNQAYYKSGIMSSEYPVRSEYNRLKNQSTGIYTFHSIIIKQEVYKHARAFKRGYGAIEQIYRWAATTRNEIDEKRPDDAFIKQIKRVARRLGWRA